MRPQANFAGAKRKTELAHVFAVDLPAGVQTSSGRRQPARSLVEPAYC